MSNLLWKYYHNGEVDRFRQLLANGSHAQNLSKAHSGGSALSQSFGAINNSPAFGGSPKLGGGKNRKISGQAGPGSGTKGSHVALSRADVNSRDYAGLTILHRAVSASSEDAISFAMALIDHPAIDLYIQDTENGWTALHRALYFGNITLARAIVERDGRDPSGKAAQRASPSLIKVKDHEGNSPFDVYNATIARRTLQHKRATEDSNDDSSESDSDSEGFGPGQGGFLTLPAIDGEEVWSWGSNRNHGLGFKDGDDRHHPEKITLTRPDHLLFRFYREYREHNHDTTAAPFLDPASHTPSSISEVPTLITNRPIIIQDVALSKLHSAVLTSDPESNLYMCGFGPGGRLGTGDETTRFSYTCIEGGSLAGKRITSVALGQNHSLALTSDGEVSSFGVNTFGQLGYSLPRPDFVEQEPSCPTPRQIFGPLKRERVIGVAASAIHSVAYTATSLFTWGKNEGQLGLMDSDSRSLELQTIPRKVAASLFKSHISMASAINGATIALLANHTVCVFTNYGYNIVKFPLHEGFTNYHLNSAVLTTRYDSISNHITCISSGGDTIAAVSTRGDLFTVNVRKIDNTPSASTTNPAKIRDSLSPPERVWSLRKGNWDGIKSAAVAENGSVIVCTQAGAVWQRIKRAKNKDAFVGTGYNRKDYKFQRIPGLTKVTAVRSTPFGVYAAIRKDCDVTRTQIEVDQQHLWQDIAPLLCVHGMKGSDTLIADAKMSASKQTESTGGLFPHLKRMALESSDLEADVSSHLQSLDLSGFDFELGTTTSDVHIPVHGYMLARSSALRAAIADFRRNGLSSTTDTVLIRPSAKVESDLKVSLFGRQSKVDSNQTRLEVILPGLDFLTIFNLTVYLYTDKVIDFWHFTQHSNLAFRYRQVRIEMMKTANQLQLTRLESAARLMTEPEPQMHVDFSHAIQDIQLFKACNTLVELDDCEIPIHSSLVCQRCPFFQGLFNGRSQGQWLASRLETSEVVRIDLKHINSSTFEIVLRYIYTDSGTEIFDNVVSADIDEFSELVLDVMAVSNELMLDRLAQICQEVIGRFVNTRNVCHLLNAISPCSVKEFKDSALEYLCLQLESMLENHLLSDLDDELLLELDDVVRANQLNCLPFAKSGRSELLLHDQYPDLAEEISDERQRRVRDMAFRTTLYTEDRMSSSYKARVGSMDDLLSASPTVDKARRRSKAARNAPFSPSIQPKDSSTELMFDMDDYSGLITGSPKSPKIQPLRLPPASSSSINVSSSQNPSEAVQRLGKRESSQVESFTASPTNVGSRSPTIQGVNSWSSPTLPSTKLGMREIMLQASSSRTSVLSMGLSAQKIRDDANPTNANKANSAKLSQKERKKQQQQAMQESSPQPTISLDTSGVKSSSPWQVAARGPKTSLQDVLDQPSASSLGTPAKSLGTPMQDQPVLRRTASPDTRFAGQRRNVKSHTSTPQLLKSTPSHSSPEFNSTKSTPVVPHSKSYMVPDYMAEPSLQLSMADIIGQQRREQEVIKEAVAKRSLQEIQEEQAFQEWWDQESKRAQEEEAARSKASTSRPARGGKHPIGRGKSSRGRGRGGEAAAGQFRVRGKGQSQDDVAKTR